jgi:hypothetical protein
MCGSIVSRFLLIRMLVRFENVGGELRNSFTLLPSSFHPFSMLAHPYSSSQWVNDTCCASQSSTHTLSLVFHAFASTKLLPTIPNLYHRCFIFFLSPLSWSQSTISSVVFHDHSLAGAFGLHCLHWMLELSKCLVPKLEYLRLWCSYVIICVIAGWSGG